MQVKDTRAFGPEERRALADLLDRDDVFDVMAGAIADSRDRAARLRDEDGEPADRDSMLVLEDVIATLRATA